MEFFRVIILFGNGNYRLTSLASSNINVTGQSGWFSRLGGLEWLLFGHFDVVIGIFL